jgi:hypothetical protein
MYTANQPQSYFDAWRESVEMWGEARKIIQHSNEYAQSVKTMEEAQKLLNAADAMCNAVSDSDRKKATTEYIDAVGDIAVTLAMGCKIAGIDMMECLWSAYDQIKDRTGHLNDAGIFVKDK